MKSQNARIFQRTENVKKKGKVETRTYYWASFSDKDKDGDFFSATIFVRMSDKAKTIFDSVSEPTKTEGIRMLYARVTDAWLKPVPGRDNNSVVWFVNRLTPYDEDEDEDE